MKQKRFSINFGMEEEPDPTWNYGIVPVKKILLIFILLLNVFFLAGVLSFSPFDRRHYFRLSSNENIEKVAWFPNCCIERGDECREKDKIYTRTNILSIVSVQPHDMNYIQNLPNARRPHSGSRLPEKPNLSNRKKTEKRR